jgi:glycosyltransferase involved in cell wall biosynthesis
MTVAGRWRDLYRRVALPAGLHTASRVITPSETLRTALLERYGLDPARVSAIPLAVDPRRFHPRDGEGGSIESGVPSPYILFVSTLWPYKNASALVSAFARLVRDEAIPHHLVLVGKDGGDESRLRALANCEGVVDRLVFTGQVDGARLPALYRHADLFVYPSLVESFGFPLLEAMASGVPVIASDRWAIPEICGDAATICDPTRVEELAAAMRDVISSPQLRADLVHRGLARARQFSWERTVSKTLRVIKEAALEEG